MPEVLSFAATINLKKVLHDLAAHLYSLFFSQLGVCTLGRNVDVKPERKRTTNQWRLPVYGSLLFG